MGSFGGNVNAYAQLVLKKSFERSVYRLGQDLVNLSKSHENPDEKLNLINTRVGMLEQAGEDDGKRASELFSDALARVRRRSEKIEPTGLRSGFTELDEKTLGFHPNNLIIVAGRPSMGKTTLAMNIARHTALNAGNVLVFSVESTGGELMDRLIADVAGVPLGRIKQGFIRKDEWPKLKKAGETLQHAALTINDTGDLYIDRLCALARKRNRQKKLDLIVVDYLQIVNARGTRDEVSKISAVSSALKKLAKTTQTPVIAVAQLNRGGKEMRVSRPTISDLKGSGQIEQDADVVLLLHREDYYKPDGPKTGIAEIIIGKQRDGVTGIVNVKDQLHYNRFENFDDGEVAKIRSENQENDGGGFY
jgi:replicative DNA helicase